jgi:hypothetical protein
VIGKQIRIYGFLLLAMASLFMLGTYSENTINGANTIEPKQWFLTSSFGLMFLLFFLDEYRKGVRNE